MAILKEGKINCEVRVKRSEDETYYDEYINFHGREKPGSSHCERYIVGKEGENFVIEATLHKDFDFEEYDRVQVKVWLPGMRNAIASTEIMRPGIATVLSSDISRDLEYTSNDVSVGGLFGANFEFRSLEVSPDLHGETDVMGIDPKDVGCFTVTLQKLRRESKRLTFKEWDDLADDQENEADQIDHQDPSEQGLWDVTKIDKKSFIKDGITQAVGLVGGRSTQADVKKAPAEYRIKNIAVKHPRQLSFNFLCRSAEFLESNEIPKYPLTYHLYPWSELTPLERETAVRELQAINRAHVYEALRAKNGGMKLSLGKMQEPREWRPVHYVGRGERASLPYSEGMCPIHLKAKLDYERGEVQKQLVSIAGDVISLVGDEPEQVTIPNDNNITIENACEQSQINDDILDCPLTLPEAGATNSPIETIEPTVAMQPELDQPKSTDERPTNLKRIKSEKEFDNEADDFILRSVKKIKVEYPSRESIFDDDLTDDELEKKKERARKLAEAIETEKRLAKLQEEQRILVDEIEREQQKKKLKKTALSKGLFENPIVLD